MCCADNAHYVSSDQEQALSDVVACAEYLALLDAHINARTATWEAENDASWATDQSVMRQFARDEAASGGRSSDLVKVERHLRKLARAQAVTRTAVTVRNADGTSSVYRFVQDQVTLRADGTTARRPDALMRTQRFRMVDNATGEVTYRKVRSRGYYQGGSGYLLVNDGRVSAASIGRLLAGDRPAGLGGRPRTGYDLAA